MGDEVNDFFARKDKKKVKKGKKTKFTTSSEVAQHVEKEVQQETERENATHAPAPLRPARRTKEDEEWTDFKEEHQPDLSGLKIQSLSKMRQAQAEQAALTTEEGGDGEDKGGEVAEDAGSDSERPAKPAASAKGKVWMAEDGTPISSASESTEAVSTESEAAQAAAAPAADAEPTKYVPPSQRRGMGPIDPPAPSAAPPSSSTGGRYVPPSRRAAMEGGGDGGYGGGYTGGYGSSSSLQPMQLSAMRRGPRHAAPDVNSDVAFPSLQTAAGAPPAGQRAAGFQDVHRGAAAASAYSQQRTSAVSVENRYSDLR